MSLRIGFIGGGQMCEAIVKGLVSRKDQTVISISEPFDARREYLTKQYPTVSIINSNIDILNESDVVVLAVKPQQLGNVMSSLKSTANPLVISICAGIPIVRLEELMGSKARIARVMPNLPAMVAEGASGFCINTQCQESDAELVIRIFSAVGAVVERVPEYLIDALTGISGSGPAYVCLFIEAMADAGVQHGLPRQTALRLAAQTCVGAGRMCLEEHPAVLKDKICSPGGASIAAVRALEDGGFRAAAMAAVTAVVQRSKELAKL